MKANHQEQPLRLELMPDGYHKFRFDIEQIANGENTSFSCNEVIIHGAVTTDKVISAVMTKQTLTPPLQLSGRFHSPDTTNPAKHT